MLIEFKIKNFRSFREETTLSLMASTDKTLTENTIPVSEFGGRSLLRSAVVYGANAAGKSNIIEAIRFFKDFINPRKDRGIDAPIPVVPFLLVAGSNTAPSEFEITFIDKENVRFQYGFHVTTKQIVREWLVAYPKGLPQTWFEREHVAGSESSWYFGRNLKGKNNQMAELTRPDVPFLWNAAKLNHLQLGLVFEWFQKSLRVIRSTTAEDAWWLYSAIKAKDNERSRSGIQTLLEVADFGISGFDIQERVYNDRDFPEDLPIEIRNQFVNKKTLDIFMYHPVKGAGDIPLPMKEESSGTQRYFALSGPLYDVLDNGLTLFVDELDASLHPLLVRKLVELFHNPQLNPKGAQLIFNTHDTTLMDCCLFRRDQIWLVEKDRQGCSHLYPLLEYSPRKDEALAKGYLVGRYGAIPFLSEPQWGEAQRVET